jgi:multicomponent Na+:H+ antiporter subunit A
VLLIGVGTEVAITAAVLYFLAHALYKAGLFLVVGIIDHETGTRDLTALGGLRDHLALTFIAAVMVAASMLGVPPLLGYFAKEEMYLGLFSGTWTGTTMIAALIIGNGALGAVALAVGLKPFMGSYLAPPKTPHEASAGLLAGPVAFGVAGIAAAFATQWVANNVINPSASVISDNAVEAHLNLGIDVTGTIFWLSVLTWLLGGLIYWRLERVRSRLRRAEIAIGWNFDKGFDAVMFGLIRFAGAVTRLLHHGRLELYLVVVFAMLGLALFVPLWSLGGLPELPSFPELTFVEWGVIAIAAIGVVTVVLASTRLFAIVGAPDLSFTQFMVEVLSVVILALVMTRLRLDREDPREFEDLLRDGSLALICGVGVTTLLFAVLNGAFDPRLGEFFNANSVPLAHGRNIVNVVIVDFRGLDTLGEISVVMAAGIAILALLRSRRVAA